MLPFSSNSLLDFINASFFWIAFSFLNVGEWVKNNLSTSFDKLSILQIYHDWQKKIHTEENLLWPSHRIWKSCVEGSLLNLCRFKLQSTTFDNISPKVCLKNSDILTYKPIHHPIYIPLYNTTQTYNRVFSTIIVTMQRKIPAFGWKEWYSKK